MSEKTLQMKCCVCGRVLTQFGWEFPVRPVDDGKCSHGFCKSCYEAELLKMKWETRLAAAALYR